MSSTNKTANYGLSQFIGTDVPGWLSDYNSDMSKIDAGIHSAKGTADSAAAQATQSANDITTINGTLSTQAAQISAAAQSASTAQTAAGQAQNTADANTASIETLSERVTSLEGESFILLTATLGAASTSVSLNYPDGFNKDNCILLSYQVFESNSWRVNGLIGSEPMVDVSLRDNDIALAARNSRVANAPVKLTIALV